MKGLEVLLRRHRLAAAVMFTAVVLPAKAQTVTTPGGIFPSETYQGSEGNGIVTFLGIRYASAPTGALRFTAPIAPAPVEGTIAATSPGSGCPQFASYFGTASTAEDCLFLNVYVPGSSISARSELPVMVFLHGGAFVYGEGSLFDPTNMAIQGNTVVVTINYRLGILGFLANAALSAQSPTGASGNYGLMDQQLALKWVRQNISSFGGNPANVTIFGESAGGVSVCANIVSPAASGLFHKAITESGPCSIPLTPLAGAEALDATIVSDLGCSGSSNAATVACLQGVSVSAILNEQTAFTAGESAERSLTAFFPIVDGYLVPKQPTIALALGEYNRVPVIEGTNHDEGRLFVAVGFDLNPGVGPLSAAAYPSQVQSFVSLLTASQSEAQTIANEVLKEYPLGNFSSPDVALASIIADSQMSCLANIADQLFSLNVPVYGYEFSDANAPMIFLPPASFPYGATHTDELQFLFSFAGDPFPLSGSEQVLATTMKSYWTNFAKNGNPNSFNMPLWAGFSPLTDRVQSLVAPTPYAEFNLSQQHHCNFWTGVLLQTAFAGFAEDLKKAGINP